jgi:(p)ppGpp synthase/HD superfamily hydrolase
VALRGRLIVERGLHILFTRAACGRSTLLRVQSSERDIPDLSFAQNLPLTRRAIEFAQQRHGAQRREADRAPFLVHPLEVASYLAREGVPDHAVAAAVLHDVLEDTDVERSELESTFGEEVTELVALVSDDPAIADEEQRKDDVRERVKRAGGYAVVVYAADKVSKVRELRMLVATGGDPDQTALKLRRHRKSLAMLEEEIPGSRVVELLRFELETLETLPPEGQPGSAG